MGDPYILIKAGEVTQRFYLGTVHIDWATGARRTEMPRVGIPYLRDDESGQPILFRNGAQVGGAS